MLGQWEDATKDLYLASMLDYDEEINNVLKKVCLSVHSFSLFSFERFSSCIIILGRDEILRLEQVKT